MKVVQRKDRLQIYDLQQVLDRCGYSRQDAGNNRHGPLLPHTIRCLIVGPSSTGKSNVMFNLLFEKNGLRFTNVYVFSKSLYQPKYVLLEKVMAKVPEVGYFPYNDNEEVIPPEDAESNSVMIFDDVSCERQNKIKDYFTRGRHKSIDCFLLGQTYTDIPKRGIRDNANMVILFRQDERNMRYVYNDHVNTDMHFETFKKMCAKAWNKDKYGFLVVVKDCDLCDGRYRIGFDKFIQCDPITS